jgi:hypothetical protein
MLVTAFAPTFLNPLGHEKLSCTGSSLIFRFKPSPCPNHYYGHLATMPPANFCLISAPVTQHSTIGLHLIRSLWAIHPKEPRHLLTRASLVSYRSLAKQISQDMNINFPCATASLMVAVRSHGFVVLCQLASSLRLI